MDILIAALMQLGIGFVISCVIMTWGYILIDLIYAQKRRERPNVAVVPREGAWEYLSPSDYNVTFFDEITEYRNDFSGR